MFNTSRWYARTLECERPIDVQKVIGQWDTPPHITNPLPKTEGAGESGGRQKQTNKQTKNTTV